MSDALQKYRCITFQFQNPFMTSAFKPGARSLWVHYKWVAGGGVLLFAATAFYGARSAYRAAFTSTPEQPAQQR
jgi:hypothetical protein